MSIPAMATSVSIGATLASKTAPNTNLSDTPQPTGQITVPNSPKGAKTNTGRTMTATQTMMMTVLNAQGQIG